MSNDDRPYTLRLLRPDGTSVEVRTRLEWEQGTLLERTLLYTGNNVFSMLHDHVRITEPILDADYLTNLADDLRTIREALGGEE